MTSNSTSGRRRRLNVRRLSVRQSVQEEFAFHLEMTVREFMDAGLPRTEAEAKARERFGRMEQYRETCQRISLQDRWSHRWREKLNNFVSDLRFATRRLVQSPLFTVIALLTLALGIGANTAVFTLVNGVVLQPLPYQEPDDLIVLGMERLDGSEFDSFSYADYLDVIEQSATLDTVGFWTWWTMDITDADEPFSVESARVSANMLSVIGTEPAQGRLFRPEEELEGNDKVALVSHALWQGHYGGRELVGTQIEIDGEPHDVVGIMPEGFRFPYVQEYGAGFWTPLPMDTEGGRNSRWINAVGRLADGADVEQVRTEMTTIGARLAAEHPGSNAGWTIFADSMHDSVISGDTRSALWIMYGVVAFVLLIACANLANLLLARMESRQHEIAVRAALGAGRRRLLRELFTESALLAIAGGALGVLLAAWSLNLLLTLVPDGIPRLDEIRFDTPVLLFGLAASLGTAMLFGLLPALHASRTDLQDTMKASSGRSGSAGGQRFRSTLVVAEIAIALVLVFGAGLLLQSFGNLMNEDIGFDPDRVLTFQLSPSREDAAQRIAFYQQVVERLSQLPMVDVAGANTAPPLAGVEWSMEYTVDGEPLPAPGELPSAEFNIVSPQYFEALGIPLVAGRFTSEDDTRDRGRVLLVNETFAARHWAGEQAIGRSVSIGNRSGDDDPEADAARPSYEIVGIVADTRKLGIDQEPPAEFYVAYTQTASFFMNYVVRTRVDPSTTIDAVRSQIWEVDPAVAIEDMGTMSGQFRRAVAAPRFNTIVMGSFAMLAVILATLGIYGVVAYSANSRTREIGVRIALGAGNGDVFRLLLGQGLMLTGIGVVVGIVLALGANSVLANLVYGVTTTDPLTYLLGAGVLTAVALLAAYMPARRATRVDPVVALRND